LDSVEAKVIVSTSAFIANDHRKAAPHWDYSAKLVLEAARSRQKEAMDHAAQQFAEALAHEWWM
jgi:hypothetical protein